MNEAHAATVDPATEVEALHTWLDLQGAPRTIADGGVTVTCSLKARFKLLNGLITMAPCRKIQMHFTHPTIGDGIYMPMVHQAYAERQEAEKEQEERRKRGERLSELMEFTASNGVLCQQYGSWQITNEEMDDPIFDYR